MFAEEPFLTKEEALAAAAAAKRWPKGYNSGHLLLPDAPQSLKNTHYGKEKLKKGCMKYG